MTTIMNARIQSCLLGFFRAATDMPNFIVQMELELANGSVCRVEMNPIKIPRLLELLKLRGFNQIESEYIQVKFEGNTRPNFIKPILANPFDSWFELDNGKYFGVDFVFNGLTEKEDEEECLDKD